MPSPHFGTLRELLAVGTDPETGACRIHWKSGDDWRTDDRVPPYACTVTAFPDQDALKARLAAVGEARDNATAHSASSSHYAMGPHVLLAVHLDQPMPPGATYEEAVTHAYEGRGTLSTVIEGGPEAWTAYIDVFLNRPNGQVWRMVEGGVEVAIPMEGFAMWLDPDLEERLREILRADGLRLVGGGNVAKVFDLPVVQAGQAAKTLRSKLKARIDAIAFAARSRAEVRILMADPAVPRMLRRLADGCVLLWSENHCKTQHLSYQMRPDGKTPTKVSGERIRDLRRLGVLTSLWAPVPGDAFQGIVWQIMGLTEAGKALLAGDVAAGTAHARHAGDMRNIRRPEGASFVDAVATFASQVPLAAREALRNAFVFTKPVALDAMFRGMGKHDAMAALLSGLVSGRAVVTESGRFKIVTPDPPDKRRRGASARPSRP